MSTTRSHRSISAAVSPIISPILAAACIAALAACSGTHGAGPSPTFDAAAGSTTYWLAPLTSEVDLQLVTIEPTRGF